MNRVMVDMSATIIHHGHIRLLKSAKEYGYVIVALTIDEEIKLKKGYEPELNFQERREILSAIKYVDEVVPSKWLIEEDFLNKHNIDFLIHGHDNSNPIAPERTIILQRTQGISSSMLRDRVERVVQLKREL